MPIKLKLVPSVSPAVVVDAESHQVFVFGRPIHVAPKEFELLSVLLKANGATVSRQTLISSVWNNGAVSDSRTVDQHIARLRRKLGTMERAVVTVPNRGYRVTSDVAFKAPKVAVDNTCKVVSVKRFFGENARTQVVVEFKGAQAALVPGSALKMEQVI